MQSKRVGIISQIIGPVIDVTFSEDTALPDIYEALEVTRENGEKITLECQQLIGERTVRTIAMDSTDGLQRGLKVESTGSPITMPIGEKVNGRLFNVIA